MFDLRYIYTSQRSALEFHSPNLLREIYLEMREESGAAVPPREFSFSFMDTYHKTRHIAMCLEQLYAQKHTKQNGTLKRGAILSIYAGACDQLG